MRNLASFARVAVATLAVVALSHDAFAYRLIQNTGVGRFSSGALVTCSNPTGFTHWNTSSITWYRNTANQGSGKATAMQSAMAAWTNVTPATYNLIYGGTTTAGWSTDGRNTALWATGNGCTGGCLAITALVLQSGQRIVETDISFNNSYPWRTDGTNYDTQAVMAHEIGHAMGIHHTELTSTPRPTMYASYFGTSGRSLESDDRNALNCIYNRYPPSGAAQAAATLPALPDGDQSFETSRPSSVPALALASRPRPGGALIRFALPAASHVKLQVFDVAGRVVQTLVDAWQPAGEHQIAWDGTSARGRASSGVYFARMATAEGARSATVILAE